MAPTDSPARPARAKLPPVDETAEGTEDAGVSTDHRDGRRVANTEGTRDHHGDVADRVVEELLAEGDAEGASPGRFGLDREVARQKLRDFQLEDPWSYPLDLISAAVRLDARHIDIVIDGLRLALRFDGHPFTREDFVDLYDALFTGGDAPGIPARRHLARAIGAAQGLGVREIEVLSGDGGNEGAYLRARREGPDDIGRPQDVPDGTRVLVIHGRGGLGGLSAAEATMRLDAAIRQKGIFTGITVTLNGETLPDGWTLPGSTDRIPFGDVQEHGSAPGVMGLVPAVGEGELRLVVDGVLVETLLHRGLRPGFVGVISDPRLRTDLGRGAVLRGPPLDEAVAAAEVAAQALEARLGHDHVEVAYYDPSTSLRRVLSDKAPVDRKADHLADFYLRLGSSGAARALDAVKRALRVTAWGLYLSPLLVIPKIVLWVLGNPIGDYLTVAFVCWVVFFFVLVNAFVLLHFVAGPRPQRKQVFSWVPRGQTLARALKLLGQTNPVSPTAKEIDELVRGLPAHRPLRLRGQVRRVGSRQSIDEAVLRDTFCLEGDWAARLTAFHHFDLTLTDGHTGSLPLRLPLMPWIAEVYDPLAVPPGLHPHHRHRLVEWLFVQHRSEGAQGLLRDGRTLVIWPGDELELVIPAGARILRDRSGTKGASLVGPELPCIIRRLVTRNEQRTSAKEPS